MKATTLTVLLFTFECLCSVNARIFQTRDAVTVDGEYLTENDKVREDETETAIITHLLPSSTFALTEKTCWTTRGEIGTCKPIRTCYPLFEPLPLSDSNDESWQTRGYTTCNYTSAAGNPVYGVCCPLKPHQSGNAGNVNEPGIDSNDEKHPTMTQFENYFTSTPALPDTESDDDLLADTTTPIYSPDPVTEVAPETNPVDDVTDDVSIAISTTELAPNNETETESSAITIEPDSVNPECGMGPFKYLNADEQRRIVGGTLAIRNSWPFLVALLKNGRQFCGGTVIDPLRVLTAAHCIAQMSSWDVGRLEVAIGMHELRPSNPSSAPVKIKVRKVTRHRGFDSRTLYNDIALVTLDSPIEYSSIASPVCLPKNNEAHFVGQDAVVIGWGSLKEGGKQPSALQQVTVRIQSNDECKRRYGRDAPGGIADHMLCASYPGKDACSGDSGGPLIVQSHPGAPWVQAGIVSWGIGCGKPPYPGVYTRVSSFARWIEVNSIR